MFVVVCGLDFVECVAETIGSPAQLQFAWWLESVWLLCGVLVALWIVLFLMVGGHIRWLNLLWLLLLLVLWGNWCWSGSRLALSEISRATVEAWVVVAFIV